MKKRKRLENPDSVIVFKRKRLLDRRGRMYAAASRAPAFMPRFFVGGPRLGRPAGGNQLTGIGLSLCRGI
jgi:hypothetical protein